MHLSFLGHAVKIQLQLDGYFVMHATPIAKACGKDITQYRILKETKAYQQYLEETLGIPSQTLIYVTGLGRGGETWIHERMAYDFAQWCGRFEARDFVAEVFHDLRVDGVATVRGQEAGPHDIVMERMFGGEPRASTSTTEPTYPSDIPGIPTISIPDEAEHALTHQLLRDLDGKMAGQLANILRELVESKQHIERLSQQQTELLGMLAELVERINGKEPVDPGLRQSLYQAAWELNARHCVGCGLALFHEDGRERYGVMTLHHVAGLMSIASRLIPLCCDCNYRYERNIDLQETVRRIEPHWFSTLWQWSKAYPETRALWARLIRGARARARGQQRWLRWRHRGEHEHYDDAA